MSKASSRFGLDQSYRYDPMGDYQQYYMANDMRRALIAQAEAMYGLPKQLTLPPNATPIPDSSPNPLLLLLEDV